MKTSQSALNTKINSEIVARQNFATDATSSISALDTKVDDVAADMIQTIELDGTTLSITSGAGDTDTYQIPYTTYSDATTSASGLMSASDKAKLNGITANANNYTLPTANATQKGGVKIGSGISVSSGKISVPTVTSSTNGLMSSTDKKKLDSLASITSAGDGITISGGIISAGGTYTLPTANATQKGGVKIGSGISVSSGKISVPTVTSSTNGLMSSTDKKKLDSLASITSAGDGITISGGIISAGGTYTLPTANATQKGGVKIGDGLSMNGDTLSANVMTGATSNTAGGTSGLVPAPAPGDQTKFLRGDGTWSNEMVLPTIAGSLAGSLWREVNNGVPVIKYTYGNTVYSLLSANVAAVAGVPAIGTALDDWTWEQISAVSLAGLGDVYFDIGDSKEITLNGNVGDYLTLENQKLRVFILHFNYPMNGTPDHNIIWGGFKTADGTDVALCDSKCDSYSEDITICFNMNHFVYSVNSGGWKGCNLRCDILGATSSYITNATAETLASPKSNTLLAALPSDFRNALRLWSRWVDAKGNSSNVEANIEETIDAVTLLTEFEVQGARTRANEYEQNHQTQLDYFKNGNGKIKYNHADTSSAVEWRLSSPIIDSYFYYYCDVGADGSATSSNAVDAYGVAPAFKT